MIRDVCDTRGVAVEYRNRKHSELFHPALGPISCINQKKLLMCAIIPEENV
jgi:hypothetical protein